MKMRHTAAWLGLTAATLVAASGCGTQSVRTADRTMAALERSADRTQAVGSARLRMAADYGTGTAVPMEGTYSWGDGYAYDVEMNTKDVRMQRVQDASVIRCLLVHGAYYYDVDPQPSGPLKGKEWMKVDASASYGDKGARAISGDAAGPAAVMARLKYAHDAEELGTETVDGRRTRHYRGVVDRAHLGPLKDIYGDKDSPMGALTNGAASVTMDVWVGADDLPVRIKERIGGLKLTMDFEKYGRTVEVKAPPVAQTADVTALVKRQQRR
ncbi:hypothetical protein [Streptomyces sp. NPDC052107]|uniref:hypothetical protein n=1 Tax=Streptomyces sp. NPDC052107 TaxID=3155632 RepID=UPI003440BC97